MSTRSALSCRKWSSEGSRFVCWLFQPKVYIIQTLLLFRGVFLFLTLHPFMLGSSITLTWCHVHVEDWMIFIVPRVIALSVCVVEIIEKVKKPPPLIRPSVSKGAAPPEAIHIMRQCWTEQPEMRPDFNQVHDLFRKLNHGRWAAKIYIYTHNHSSIHPFITTYLHC